MASSVEVQQMTDEQLNKELVNESMPPLPKGVMVYVIEGPFFFGAVENFQRALAATHTDPKILILRMRWVPFIDITGLQTMQEVIKDLQKRKVRVLMSGANPLVTEKMEKVGIIKLLGEKNFFAEFPQALAACHAL
jgi:SulP family sulfate permease